MRHIQPFKAGVSVGAVIGLWHLEWVSLVADGWAKPFMDFVLRLHFIELQFDLGHLDRLAGRHMHVHPPSTCSATPACASEASASNGNNSRLRRRRHRRMREGRPWTG